MSKWVAHAPLDMGIVGGVNKQIIKVADAVLADDVPAFHQIADAILPVSSAQFLVLAATADLANERVFTPGAGLTAVDAGAGLTYALTNDVLTGKAGGQTWVGGTASGNPLTINVNSTTTDGVLTVYMGSAVFSNNSTASGNIGFPAVGTFALYNGVGGTVHLGSGGVTGRIILSSTGTVTVADLAGGTTALVRASTTGLLSRTTVATADIDNDAVTYAKIQNVTAADRLLGRGNGGGAGDVQEIALGTSLSMSSTTLNVSGLAPDSAQYLVLATSASLSAERVLLMSTGFTTSDGGANGNYTVTNDVLTGKAGGQTWIGGTASGNPLTVKANTSSNGTLALTATTVTTSGAIQVSGTIRGDIGDGNNTIQLLDGADRNVFRGIQFPAWTDSLSAMWFQVGAVSGSTMFTTLTAAPFTRLAFLATNTQFTAGSYSTTPVPTGIFDVLNASQSLKFSVASGGGVTLSSLSGAGTILVKADNAGLLGAASATTDYTAIITLTAGNGMTGGGTTAANRTFDVATADATIVINADSIQAGVMQTANIANDAITYAKIQNVTASRLLGRDSSGGDVQEIVLGTNLSLSGTTLNAASTGAPTGAQYLTLATDAGLSAERVLVMSTGFTTSDGGANGNYTVTNDVFTGQSGSPTWQGSTSAGSLSIRANTAVTGTINLRATQVSMFLGGSEYFIATAGAFAIGSSYLAINQASPLSTAYLDADVTGSRENVRFKVAGTTISDNGSRSYFQVFPRSGVTVGSGVVDASQIWTTMYLESTTFTAASGSPVTFAATTFYIANAPVAAGGLTITNPYAMWVDDGRSRFDGDSSGYVFELPDLDTVTANDPDKQLKVWVRGIGVRYIDLRQA